MKVEKIPGPYGTREDEGMSIEKDGVEIILTVREVVVLHQRIEDLWSVLL